MAPKQAPARVLYRPVHKRAAGIIRVSEVAGREGEAFRSPGDQLKLLKTLCAEKGYELVATFEELDVSGYTLSEIHQRKHGLSPAIKMIEAGEADVLLLPWLDRIARNLTLFRAARKRVELAGGSIEAVDFGVVTGGSAAQNFSVDTLIRVGEFFAELTAEKTQKAKEAAIAQGIPTFDRMPFGLRKDMDPTSPTYRRIIVHEEEAEVVRAAFAMREAGARIEEIRDFVRSKGAKYGIRGVQHMLQQRMYLGELRFGKLVNLHSHQPIISPAVFRSVQGKRVSRGPKGPGTQRLLARLAIVRCAYCLHPMVIGRQTRHSLKTGVKVMYYDYRCSSMQDCKQRVAISADILEEAVARFVKQADADGHATADEELDIAEATYDQAETALRNVVEMLTGLGDLKETQAKLAELRASRDQAYEHCQQLRAMRGTAGVRASDWDILTYGDRRALICSTIRSITVSRGVRGTFVADRVKIETFA